MLFRSSTGRVEELKAGRDKGYAVVYGGVGTSGALVGYANQVHDDLRPRIYKKPGSGPKFLSTHAERRAAEAGIRMDGILRQAIRNIFGGR